MSIGFKAEERNNPWVVTPDVIETVLDEYDLVTDENIQKGVTVINSEDVEQATLNYEDNWDKLQAAFAAVEAGLRAAEIIPDEGNQFWKAA